MLFRISSNSSFSKYGRLRHTITMTSYRFFQSRAILNLTFSPFFAEKAICTAPLARLDRPGKKLWEAFYHLSKLLNELSSHRGSSPNKPKPAKMTHEPALSPSVSLINIGFLKHKCTLSCEPKIRLGPLNPRLTRSTNSLSFEVGVLFKILFIASSFYWKMDRPMKF